MPATYDLTTSIGRLRLSIGDTSTSAATFQDEELQVFLDRAGGSIEGAAALAATALANKYADDVDVTAGDVAVRNSQRSAAWGRRAAEMETAGGFLPVTMWAGGISIDDRVARYQDTDRQPSFFTRYRRRPAASGIDPYPSDRTD